MSNFGYTYNNKTIFILQVTDLYGNPGENFEESSSFEIRSETFDGITRKVNEFLSNLNIFNNPKFSILLGLRAMLDDKHVILREWKWVHLSENTKPHWEMVND